MKEKILLKLKEACGQNTSISDKTLEKIAETLAGSVTDETQIDAAIELQKPILQAIDGNINHVAAEAVKKIKPEKPVPPTPPEKPQTTDPNEPEWFKAYREKQDQETLTLKNKIEGYEKAKTTELLSEKVKAKLKEKNVDEDWLIGRSLNVESEDQIDQLVTGLETNYASFVQKKAEQGVIISVPKSSSAGAKEGELLGEQIAEKRNSGTSEGVPGKKIV